MREAGPTYSSPTQTERTRMRSDDVQDQFDVSLEDSDLLGEVELTTNLIIAASESDEHLSVDEIDKILGVVPPPRSED
jgi:hypothetical protein